MNYEILIKLWKAYWSDDNRRFLRFGQYVFNKTGYETPTSYYKENAFEAYNDLLASINYGEKS